MVQAKQDLRLASLVQLQSLTFDPQRSTVSFLEFPGGYTAGVTPVPIPNTVVKPRRADDTALVTAWERRSPPGLIKTKKRLRLAGAFFLLGGPTELSLNPIAAVLSWKHSGGARETEAGICRGH